MISFKRINNANPNKYLLRGRKKSENENEHQGAKNRFWVIDLCRVYVISWINFLVQSVIRIFFKSLQTIYVEALKMWPHKHTQYSQFDKYLIIFKKNYAMALAISNYSKFYADGNMKLSDLFHITLHDRFRWKANFGR